jgi:hypothetical protein
VSLTRRFSLLALAMAGLLGLSACSGDQGGGAAIEVNGETVSFNEFSSELRTYQDDANELVRQSLEQQAAGQGLSVEATGTDALPSGVAASIATSRIVYMLVDQELAERDIEVTEEQVEATRAELSAPATDPASGAPTGQENPFSSFSEEFQAQYAEDQAALSALRDAVVAEGEGAEVAEPTDDEVAALIAQTGVQSCLTGIATADEAVATEAADRAQAGEDLAAVVAELDPTADPDLGCVAETGSPELDEAIAGVAEGELSGVIALPAETGGGFVVVRVDERGPLSEEDARTQLVAQAEQAAAQEDPLTPVIEEAFADADIRVASRYGSWDAELRAVVPPEGPVPSQSSTTLPAIDPATGLPAQEVPVEGG